MQYLLVNITLWWLWKSDLPLFLPLACPWLIFSAGSYKLGLGPFRPVRFLDIPWCLVRWQAITELQPRPDLALQRTPGPAGSPAKALDFFQASGSPTLAHRRPGSSSVTLKAQPRPIHLQWVPVDPKGRCLKLCSVPGEPWWVGNLLTSSYGNYPSKSWCLRGLAGAGKAPSTLLVWHRFFPLGISSERAFLLILHRGMSVVEENPHSGVLSPSTPTLQTRASHQWSAS